MNRLLSIPALVVALIFSGLCECVIETLIDEHSHPLMPLGYSFIGVGFAIISGAVAIGALIFAIAAIAGQLEKDA